MHAKVVRRCIVDDGYTVIDDARECVDKILERVVRCNGRSSWEVKIGD